MAFDGSYPRRVREAGQLHRIFVRRVHCRRCGVGDALLPEFVLRRRRDTTAAVGAAVLARLGVDVPHGATVLYEGVPERTIRSWRHRFAERADELAQRFEALCVEWGSSLPLPLSGRTGALTPPCRAVAAIGGLWRAAYRRCGQVPPAWWLANIVVGGQLLSVRVDLPWPIAPGGIGRSRGPGPGLIGRLGSHPDRARRAHA